MKPSTLKIELPPSTPLRKVVFGGALNSIPRRSRSVVLSSPNPFVGSVTGVLLALGLWLVPAVLPVNAAAGGIVVGWGNGQDGQTTAPAGLSGVTAVAAGQYHTVALKNDGTIVAWGYNFYGQTNIPSGLSGVTAIAAGNAYTVALKSDGSVVAWGRVNAYGVTTVPANLSGVTAIAAGNGHTVALKNDGTVVVWGWNSVGQTTIPASLSGVTAIAANNQHTLALKNDGTVVAWGNNFFGQTTVPAGLSGVTAIAAGSLHSVAIVPPPPLPAFTGFSGTATVAPIRSSNPWRFTMVQSSLAPDLRVRVQSSLTPDDEESWEFLAGFATRLDSNWTLNTIDVPMGTRYFRAIATAPGYADRVTDPLAMIGPITVLDGIAPFGGLLRYGTTAPERTGTEWKFVIVQSSLVSDLRLRVQSSTNGQDSWSDLPGGGRMGRVDSKWTHVTSEIPLGTQFFRVVASAPTYADRVSAVRGPFDIGLPRPRVPLPSTGTGNYGLLSIPELQDPVEVYLIAVGQANFYLVTGAHEEFFRLVREATITLEAAQNAAASLTIEAGQSLTIQGLNIGQNTTLILEEGSELIGDLRLIGNDVGTLIANDGGTLIGHDGGSMVAGGGGNIVAGGGGNIVAGGGGNIVASGGGNIVASGGGNIVAGGDGNKPVGTAASGRVNIAGGGPAFTGVMTVIGNYAQEAGTGLFIAIAGTNSINSGAQEYDQLLISGRAELAGTIGFALFDPNNVTNKVNLFQPTVGATFDVVVATNIVIHDLIVRGPIWGDGLHFNWSVVNRADGKQAVRLVAVRIAPALIFQTVGGKVEAAYPTNFTGYTLQRSPTLSPTNWTTFSTATNRIVIDPTNAAGFFRLFKP